MIEQSPALSYTDPLLTSGDSVTNTPAKTPERKPRLVRRWAGEIIAIFLGISASFWVDDWREERQDTETFNRILGEVYYNIMMDDAALANLASVNNLALTYASDLVLREGPLPPPEALFRQIETILSRGDFRFTTGGYDRLINTPLAIPVNDIQLALDDLYAGLEANSDASRNLNQGLQNLGTEHWWKHGVIPCFDPSPNIPAQPDRLARLDLEGQLAPVLAATYSDLTCLADPFNHRMAVEVMETESFRTALKTAINIRQTIAASLINARLLADFIRGHLLDYLPDIGLPVESLHILGSATEVGWDYRSALPLQREGPNDWVGDVTLGAGAVKFLANREWTINWGAQSPWIASDIAGEEAFNASTIDRTDVFPANRGHLNGMNIPVVPGRYRVRFSTQTFEYSFEPLD